jgi:HEAT repeat protein
VPGGIRTPNLLIEVLEQPSDFIVTDAAARALGNLKAKSAVEKLIPMLLHSNEYVRRSVAAALATIGDQKAIEPLQQAIVKEKNEETRSALESALQRLSRDIQK